MRQNNSYNTPVPEQVKNRKMNSKANNAMGVEKNLSIVTEIEKFK